MTRTGVEPLISVLIPSYNYAQYITRATDSALRQTYPNVEVVITDNRSTDATLFRVRERYGGEPRVRVFENDRNVGIVPNFNRALAQARGEFVLWCSADDWLLPPHLMRLHEVLRRNAHVDVCYSSTYLADAAGRPYTVTRMPGHFPVDYVDARDELVELLTGPCHFTLPTALFRRAVLDELGGMDEAFRVAADWELAVRLACAGKRFAFLSEPSMVVRSHPGQASGDSYAASGEVLAEFVQLVEKFIDHPAMERMRGRELGIARLCDGYVQLVRDTARERQSGYPAFFTPEFEARVVALKQRLFARYQQHEPARVREARVTIVMPTIGPPPLLERAIDSVAAQTFANWELVVVDQAPFPLGNLLCDRRASESITTVRFPSAQSAGAARNQGLRLARGEYVGYLDDDDTLAPHHLEALVTTIERTGAEAAAASARLIFERADDRYLDVGPLGEAPVFRDASDGPHLGRVANALPLSTLLHHRRLFGRGLAFDADLPLLEDFEYVLRLEEQTRIAFTRVVTADVHVRLGLHRHALGRELGRYLTCLDTVYRAHPAEPEVGDLRMRQREALVRVLLSAVELAATPVGLARMLAALAGRVVIPAPTAR